MSSLDERIKNELLDYAYGQVVSGSPIDKHITAIKHLIDDEVVAELASGIAAAKSNPYQGATSEAEAFKEGVEQALNPFKESIAKRRRDNE